MKLGTTVSFFIAVVFLSRAFANVPRDVDLKTWPTDMLIIAAAGDYASLPDAAAQAELARRPNLAEELISELERVAATDSPSTRHQLYIGTLTRFTSPSLEQRTRVLTMVKQAYRKEKKSTAESDLSHMDRLLFQQAPLAFVAYENPEAEAMLLDMISRAEIRGNIETAIEKAAQKPTVEGLRAMRRRLADMMQKYPADVSRGASSYVSLVRAIETAERLLPGQADVRSTSPQPDAQLNSATVSGSERRGGKNPGSFWKEPFAWLSGALALAAVLVVLLRCTKGHRARA